EITKDLRVDRELKEVFAELSESVRKRWGLSSELEVLRGSVNAIECLVLLSRMKHDEMEKATRLLLMANEIKLKNTLAEYMILSGADNCPPMLDKDLYDSWKSRMEVYMQNREHGRMILELVKHGPLIWPLVEENGVIRTKKYDELSAAEKIQVDCDTTNIILQGLPADIYSLVNHHRVAKDL
nr:hypothetical protein [Tanacetum cinerariifolium]